MRHQAQQDLAINLRPHLAAFVKDRPMKVNTSSFACLPPYTAMASPPKHTSPLIVFAEPRSGSNLLFNMLGMRNDLAKNSYKYQYDIGVWPLFELFADYDHQDSMYEGFVFDRIHSVCDLNAPTNAEDSKDPVFDRMKAILEARRRDPKGLLNALQTLPSFAKNGNYYAFKIFRKHLATDTFDGGDPSNLIRMIQQSNETVHVEQLPKFAILWRRRIIEQFVSHQLAKESGKWTDADASHKKVDTIRVDKIMLEEFIEEKRTYYLSVKKALDAAGVEYAVFEYDRDLLDEDQQLVTAGKLETFLGAKQRLGKATMSKTDRKKQQQKDIADVIINWDEVVEWGYGGDKDEWEDIFS